MKLEVLHCQEGDHEWKRERKRGRKPVNCPDHRPVLETLESQERLDRLAEGRRKASLAKAQQAAVDVKAMSAWIRDDAAYYRAKSEIENGLRDMHDLPSKPLSVKIPSDSQYKLAREHGLIP